MSGKISVIIPVYNGEKVIAQAIESILKQTRPADEIVVVDDGSTDNTRRILETYADRIKYKVVSNGGCASARNVAIKMSSGDWIAFLDSDDIWYTEKLETQMKILDQYPEVGLCCSNFHFRDDNTGKILDHFSAYCAGTRGLIFDKPIPEALPILLRVNFVGVSTTLVRRTVLDKVGLFDVTRLQVEDYNCWLNCALETPFLVAYVPLMEKLKTFQNLTGNWIENCRYHNVVLEDFFQKHDEFLKKKGWLSLLKLKMAGAEYEIGDIYTQRREFVHAWRSYLSGLQRSVSLKNFLTFGWVSLKSTLRMLLGDLIKR